MSFVRFAFGTLLRALGRFILFVVIVIMGTVILVVSQVAGALFSRRPRLGSWG
jgi:hypothetical protein